MVAWATRWPCDFANSVPMRVRSKPTALPYGPQHLEIRAGAAAAIEDPRRRHAGGGARERGPHVLAESTKPEVRLLGPVGQFK